MRRGFLPVLSLLAVFFASLPSTPGPDPIPSEAQVVIVLTGGNEVTALPCGCSSDQSGGIAQIAKVIDDLRAQVRTRSIPFVHVDLTRAASSPSQEKLIRSHLEQVQANLAILPKVKPSSVFPAEAFNYDSHSRTLALSLAKIAPKLTDPSIPKDLVVQVDGTLDAAAPIAEVPAQIPQHRIKIPELVRGGMQLLLLTKVSGGYRIASRRYVTSLRDATDDATQQLVDGYYAEEKKHVDDARLADLASRTSSWACKDCHPAEFATWRRTAHSRALRTLVDQKKDVPECLKCHQHDEGTPTTAVNSVECASCHPSADRHAFSPNQFPLKAADAKAACASCHTKETDPKFHYDLRYRLIDHSLKKK